MSAKANLGQGLFAATVTTGPRAGRTVYYARVWVKSQGKAVYFNLRETTEERARKRLGAIAVDADKAFLERAAQKAARKAGPEITFEDLVKRFLAGYKSRGESGYYAHASVCWIDHFKKAPAARVTRAMVEDFRDAMKRKGYGDSTIRKYVGNLGTLFRWAKGRGILPDDAVLAWSRKGEGVARPKEPRGNVAVLSREDEGKLLAAADEQTRLVIRLMVETGMRQGDTPGEDTESFTLRWGQVVGDSILIHKSKNGKARAIPVNGTIRAVLDDCLSALRSDILRRDIKAGKAPSAYVLADADGHRLDADQVWRRIESAMQRAEITKPEGSRYNLFRHTLGSRLAERGVPFETIAEIMGNSPDMVRRHYVRFSPGHLQAAMALLDAPTVTPAVTRPGSRPQTRTGESLEAVAGQ